jgi:hypothetical protein
MSLIWNGPEAFLRDSILCLQLAGNVLRGFIFAEKMSLGRAGEKFSRPLICPWLKVRRWGCSWLRTKTESDVASHQLHRTRPQRYLIRTIAVESQLDRVAGNTSQEDFGDAHAVNRPVEKETVC